MAAAEMLFGVKTLPVAVLAVAPHAEPEKLSIIDAHGHLNGDVLAETLIALMDRAGVSRMVLMARYYGARAGGLGSDEQALAYATKYPGRFIPFVAGQRPVLVSRMRWLSPDRQAEDLLRNAEAKLRSGEFYGLGEFIMLHYAYTTRHGETGGEQDVNVPVDSPLMRRFADLATAYRVPLLIHLEAEPDAVAQMARLLEYASSTKVIWAHNCGRASANQIKTLLARYPNLLCDLGGMMATPDSGYGHYWPRRTPWMHLIEDGSGQLYPDMKALYEAYPDRFLIGTDAAHTPALADYERRIHRFRQILSNLQPETTQRLAFKNAEELFRR
ncbi:MAG: amidohydrolase family protein [Deltaproteobacteria bacterium]|nr:amidohydrolase family protein [Deltaproteobacteria bacterium]